MSIEKNKKIMQCLPRIAQTENKSKKCAQERTKNVGIRKF